MVLQANFQDAGSLISPVCAARASGERTGSFTVNTGFKSPVAPDEALISFSTPFNQLRGSTADDALAQAERSQFNGDFYAALAIVESALTKASTPDDRARLYNALGNSYIAVLRSQAMDAFSEGINNNPSPSVLARLLHNRANLNRFEGNHAEALSDYAKASKIADQSGDAEQTLISEAATVQLLVDTTQAEAARQIAEQTLIQTHSPTMASARALLHMAANLASVDTHLSVRLLIQSNIDAQYSGDDYTLSYVLGNLGGLYAANGQRAEALRHTRMAILQAQQ